MRSGKLVALGVTAERRSSYLPDIPALGETIKGVDAAVIAGVLAPAGTPPAVIERLNAEFAKASETPEGEGDLRDQRRRSPQAVARRHAARAGAGREDVGRGREGDGRQVNPSS